MIQFSHPIKLVFQSLVAFSSSHLKWVTKSFHAPWSCDGVFWQRFFKKYETLPQFFKPLVCTLRLHSLDCNWATFDNKVENGWLSLKRKDIWLSYCSQVTNDSSYLILFHQSFYPIIGKSPTPFSSFLIEQFESWLACQCCSPSKVMPLTRKGLLEILTVALMGYITWLYTLACKAFNWLELLQKWTSEEER